MDKKPTTWIAGLMRENYRAVGFIPETTLQSQYIDQGRYILQQDERGHAVGYLLHGALTPGGLLVVSQHCIDMDKRLRGYGEQAFKTLLERARQVNCQAIRLHCAEDLESNAFWTAQEFQLVSVKHPQNTRKRALNVYRLDLWPSLFDIMAVEAERQVCDAS